jgi:type IV pilus assembly protein PilE
LMQQQERYFSENNTYLAFAAGASDPAARRFQWWSGSSAASSAYELAGQACEGQAIAACIELRATPGTEKVDSHFRDAACGSLSLSSDGTHKAGGRAEHCWP